MYVYLPFPVNSYKPQIINMHEWFVVWLLLCLCCVKNFNTTTLITRMVVGAMTKLTKKRTFGKF